MDELAEAGELGLREAKRRAHASGRADIAQYLALRAQNDLLRRTAIDWLVDTLTTFAADANRRGAAIQIELSDPHNFRVGPATMVGTRLTLRHGVRALSIESGWPRTPRDGIVRGNGLACANLKHLGRPRQNAQLRLARSSSGAPQWFILEKNDSGSRLTETQLRATLPISIT